jgi:hypothetical protein
MQTEPIRRHVDGSIHYDYYRNRALTLRAETMTGFFKGLSAIKKPLALIASLAAAFAAIRPDQFIG